MRENKAKAISLEQMAIAGKVQAKEHTEEMAVSMLGGCWANARPDAWPDAWQWLRGLCALLYSGIPTRWSESKRIVYA